MQARVDSESPLRVRAADPAGTTQVNRVLRRAGLGALPPDNTTSYPGRNTNWTGTTERGHSVFVKQVGGDSGDSLRRFRRSLSFEELADRNKPAGLRRPRRLCHDEESRILVFELLPAVSGNELLTRDAFGADLAHEVGLMLAELHELPSGEADGLDRTPHPLPPSEFFDALPERAFLQATHAELEFWWLLQSDRQLVAAIGTLRGMEARAPHRPAHCDLRFDQLLIADGVLHLSDWEEFRFSDPARDVGGFLGELLWTGVTRIPASSPDENDTRQDAHGTIVARGVQELERLRPIALAFWDGYRGRRSGLDPGLPCRANAFAGWHLLDRVLASGSERGRLSPTQRAAVGIGRSVLIAPHRFIRVLGMGGTA